MKKRRYFLIGFICLITSSQILVAQELYQQYEPETTTRVREAIEWSITYTYNSQDTELPRVLLIGDSICNAYQNSTKDHLYDKMNVSYWASSKCVTDKDYFRELDFILSGYHYDIISFNNGLHSIGTNQQEWEKSYKNAILFIQAKCPDAKLFLCNNSIVASSESNQAACRMNKYVQKIADELSLPMIDMYSFLDKMDHEHLWSDGIHFQPEVISEQGKMLSEIFLNAWENR